MYKMDFSKPCHVHFIGIGGISMSGLAEILMDEGFTVSGSDNQESDVVKKLVSDGAQVAIGQKAENITDDIDVVCYTAAIHSDNPELKAAKDAGIPLLTRAQLLGQLMTNYRDAICISGTHGKTTTTSLVTHMLFAAGQDPTVSIGGMLPAIGGNYHIGRTDEMVLEACEYTNSFLSFHPTIAAILNIEEDHLDFFRDLDDIRNSFREFAELLPENGLLVINGNIQEYKKITRNVKCPVVTFGNGTDCDYTAENVDYDDLGCPRFDVVYKGKVQFREELKIEGDHNILNALAATAIALHMGVSPEAIQKGLLSYTGTHRRFEKKGVVNGFTIVDDYAHHPTEIKATLNAAARYPHRDTWVVFQPHTFSRTRAFLPEFAEALSMADHVVLADIYSAREIDTGEISSRDIKKLLDEKHVDCYYFPSFDEIEKFLLEKVQKDDLLITMGAGNVVKIGEDLLSK